MAEQSFNSEKSLIMSMRYQNKVESCTKIQDVVNQNESNPINMVIDKHMKGYTGELDYDDILSRVKSSEKG